MVAAALIAHTNVGGPVGAGSATNSPGLVEGVYAVTIVTTLDWVVLSDFAEIKYATAYTTATGVAGVAYVDSTTKNKVFVTTTGATTLFIKGTPKV